MFNSKNTKRSLLMSALALVLCVSMLVGSTFAWFTDTATTGVNRIQSGTLDIELLMLEDGQWVNAEDKTLNFIAADGNEDILWEPGCTYELPALKVVNKGNLALKYEILITGIEGNAKLLEVIDFTIEGEDALTGTLAPQAETPAITLIGHMAEEADNNYQNLSLEGLSITVYATQMTAENDSYGPDYDKESVYADAYVTTANDLAAAVAEGGIVALMGDIDLADLAAATTYSTRTPAAGVVIPKGVEVVINLNGYNITGVSDKDSGNQKAFTVYGNLTVVGEGTITYAHTGANMGWSALTAAFSVEGGNLTLGKGVVVIHEGGSDMAYAVDVNSTLGETVLNIDGAILKSSYIGVRLFNNHTTQKAIVNLNSGVVDGPRRDIWVQYTKPYEVNIAEGYTYEANDGDYFFDTAVVNDAEALVSELQSGNSVVLLNDVDMASASSNGYGATGISVNSGVLDGNNQTLTVTGANGTWDSAINITGGTIKNLTIDNGFRGIFVNHNSSVSGKVYLENVVIDGPTYTISCDQGTGNGLEAINSTFNGWTSYAATIGDVKFVDCSFGEGAGYSFCRPYAPTEFVGCDFAEGYELDARAAVTFENCTLNGVALTAENLDTLVVANIQNATVK